MTRWLWDSTSTSYFKPPLDYFNPSEFCGKQLPNLLKVNGGQILNHFRRRDIFWPRQRGFSKQVTKVPWKNGLLRGKLVMKVPLMTELLLDHCWLQKKKKSPNFQHGVCVSLNQVPAYVSNSSPSPYILNAWDSWLSKFSVIVHLCRKHFSSDPFLTIP